MHIDTGDTTTIRGKAESGSSSINGLLLSNSVTSTRFGKTIHFRRPQVMR